MPKSKVIKNPEEICLTLVVGTHEEVDNWLDHLIKENVNIKRPPQYSPAFKIYNGFYLDPSGYTIEIQAFDKNARPAGAEFLKKNKIFYGKNLWMNSLSFLITYPPSRAKKFWKPNITPIAKFSSIF